MNKKIKKNYGVLAFIMAVAMVLAIFAGHNGLRALAEDDVFDVGEGAQADPTPTQTLDYVNAEDYLTGFYNGTITKDGSNMYEGPGTKDYNKVKTSAGENVTFSKGVQVTIIGESKDKDLDKWYHVQTEFKGEAVSGYVWEGRVERQAQVTFTPTPTVGPTDTPTPTPTVEGAVTEVITEEKPEDVQKTEEMSEEAKSPKIWIWVLVVALIIIAVFFTYTLLSHREEERLEEEMKRYNNNNNMERLDGEDEEDWKKAVEKHRSQQLVGMGDIAEDEDDFTEDVSIDMTGIFSDDEEPVKSSSTDALDYTEELDVDSIRDEIHQMEKEDAKQYVESKITAATDDWTEEDEAYVNSLTQNMSEEDKALFGKLGSSLTAEAGLSQEEWVRNRLDQLKEQDLVMHKLYGEGEVIDNSDAEVIQIRFGNDLRFLKKEKLAKKDLIVF